MVEKESSVMEIKDKDWDMNVLGDKDISLGVQNFLCTKRYDGLGMEHGRVELERDSDTNRSLGDEGSSLDSGFSKGFSSTKWTQ